MPDPVSARMSAQPRPGRIVRGGLNELKLALFSREGADAFGTWSGQGLTKLFVSALRDIALNPPRSPSEDQIAVQYGMTLGLSLAAQLIEDPSVVIPGALGTGTMPLSDAPEGAQPPEEKFDTPADGVDG